MGWAGAGTGLVLVRLVGLVEGAGGGTLRTTVVAPVVGSLAAPVTPPEIRDRGIVSIPFATGGFGADGKVGFVTTGLVATGGIRPVGFGEGRRAGAGGGATGAGLGAGISSLR